MGFVLGAQFPQCLCILLARQVLVLPVERGQGQSRYNGSAGGEILPFRCLWFTLSVCFLVLFVADAAYQHI